MTLISGPGGQEPLVDIEGQSQEQQQKQQQMIIQEEHDIEQLQERERAVRQLESDILDVNTIFKQWPLDNHYRFWILEVCSGDKGVASLKITFFRILLIKQQQQHYDNIFL